MTDQIPEKLLAETFSSQDVEALRWDINSRKGEPRVKNLTEMGMLSDDPHQSCPHHFKTLNDSNCSTMDSRIIRKVNRESLRLSIKTFLMKKVKEVKEAKTKMDHKNLLDHLEGQRNINRNYSIKVPAKMRYQLMMNNDYGRKKATVVKRDSPESLYHKHKTTDNLSLKMSPVEKTKKSEDQEQGATIPDFAFTTISLGS